MAITALKPIAKMSNITAALLFFALITCLLVIALGVLVYKPLTYKDTLRVKMVAGVTVDKAWTASELQVSGFKFQVLVFSLK